MAEYPISFKPSMVRDILAGMKTETRRIVRPPYVLYGWQEGRHPLWRTRKNGSDVPYPCPYGKPGDTLWVRERWYYEEHMHDRTEGTPDLPEGRFSSRLVFHADSPDYPVNVGVGRHGWRPSIHLPKSHSRIRLTNTGSRFERLHDITEAGAIAEGVFRLPCGWWPDLFCIEGERGYHSAPTAIEAYRLLWDEIANQRTSAKGGIPCDFDANPLVWVVQFQVREVRGGR